MFNICPFIESLPIPDIVNYHIKMKHHIFSFKVDMCKYGKKKQSHRHNGLEDTFLGETMIKSSCMHSFTRLPLLHHMEHFVPSSLTSQWILDSSHKNTG